MIIFHDPRCTEYSAPGHPERPTRISRTVPVLKTAHPDWQWVGPVAATDEELLLAHTREHLEQIREANHDFDADTPVYGNVDLYARLSAGAAIGAARAAAVGKPVFSLMRPPGHHAMRDRAMGFCYFSNIAVAALDALAIPEGNEARPRSTPAATNRAGSTPPATGKCRRVAIWDFDAHHGNGTEAIVANDARIRFASVHQFPAYPGTGAKSFANIHNYPVAPGTDRREHVAIVRQALDDLIEFRPDLLLVSAGFDAYAGDPLVEMTLQPDDFASFGSWLRESDLPLAAILEGGYSDDLPKLIDAFLSGWAG